MAHQAYAADDDQYYDDGYGDDNEVEKPRSAEEKDAQAQRCIQCANVMLMVFGVGLVALGFYTGESSYGGAWSAYAVAGVGAVLVFVCLLGCIGAFRASRQMLRFFYTCMIFAGMSLVVLGGFCFILVKQSQNYIETEWDRIVAEASASERDSLDLEDSQALVKRNLILCGVASYVTLLIVLSVLSNVVRLVTRVSAYSIMLQSCCITLLPFGVVLISAGLFIADTAASVEAPVAAFAVFVMGVIVIMLSLLGCFAVTIESRGIMRLFMYIVFVLAVLFLLFGLVALVQAETLKQRLTDRWESIRRVLPPTFSGKFDREQFEVFLEANLLLLGFLSICMGILLGLQWYASIRLRSALKAQAAEDEEEYYNGDGTVQNRPNRMKVVWKRQWTHGSKKSRRCIKGICCCVLLGFVLAIVLATLALYFSTSCASLSSFEETNGYYDIGSEVYVNSEYTRGLTHLSINSSAVSAASSSIFFTKSAFRSGLQVDGFPALTNASSSNGISVVPGPKTKVMGFDISCQLADLEVGVAPASMYSGNDYAASLSSPSLDFLTISDRAGIEVDLSEFDYADRPRFKRASFETTSGPIDIKNLLIGAEGVSMKSDLGELTLEQVDGHCDEDTLGEPGAGIVLETDRGSVSVVESTFVNCDVSVVGSAALIYMDSTDVTNTAGGAKLAVTGERGLIEMSNITSYEIDIKSDAGSVRTKDITATRFRAASASGAIEAQNLWMPLRSVVQAETDSGGITLSLSRFAGIVNVVTGGRVTCTGDGFQTVPRCDVTRINGQNHVQRAEVNCVDDCLYSGSLTVTSASGSVSIHADLWSR